MPIALVSGPANAGKAQFVLDALRAHAARGDDPLLVVPTEADQSRYRRELAESGVTIGVRVERFSGLFEELLRRSRLAERALGRHARERLLVSLAASRLARPARAGHGLADALADLIAELEVARVTPARLREALGRWRASGASSLSLEGVCDVFEAYQRALARMRRADPDLLRVRALDELRRKPSLWGCTPVLLYGFDSFTDLQLDAIETLGATIDARVTVSLAYERGRRAFAGRASALRRLEPLASSHAELAPRAEHYAPAARAPLHHLERSLLEEQTERADPQAAVRLLEGDSPRAELELLAGEARALLEQGFAAEEIAIVHRRPETIAPLLAEALDDAGVPHCVRAVTRFAHTAIGRALLGLMRCAFADGQLGDLLAWLRAPGVLSRPELADRLEARARRRGALSAEQSRSLWESEHWPLDRIERLHASARECAESLLDALCSELQRLFESPRRGLGEPLSQNERDEARALASGLRALEELRELARLAPEHAGGPAELIELLEELELSDRARSPSGAVTLVDPLSLRARRVRALFVCGMQQGVFPAPAPAEPLLGREQRRQLSLASGLLLSAESPPDALDSERYLLYALCSRPEERLVLSWHTASEDGSPIARSLFVDDVCDLFETSLEREIVREPSPLAPPPPLLSPAPLSTPAPFERAQDEIVVRRVGAGRPRPAGHAPPAGRARPAGERAAATARPGPIESLSDERVLAELSERTLWSASALECFNACPVRWFVERLLRAQTLDPDAEPLARGALAHAALRQTLEGLRERTGSARLCAASLPEAKRLLAQAIDENAPEHPLSVLPECVPSALRRLHSELERYVETAAASENDLEPTYFELEFGFADDPDGRDRAQSASRGGSGAGESEAGRSEVGGSEARGAGADSLPPLDLGEGVLLRGRIDRVDLSPDGEAVVYDYKGRACPPGARWARDGVVQVALYMTALEQLLGKRVAGGFYQPLAGADIRPRGLLDAESDVRLADCVRTDRLPRAELEEVLRRCRTTALAAAAEARAGKLEPRPATCAHGGGCMYPEICRHSSEICRSSRN